MAELNGSVAQGGAAAGGDGDAGKTRPGFSPGEGPAVDTAQAQAQAEQEAAERAEALEEAEATAKAGVKAYMAGERAALRERMAAAGLFHDYLVARMGLVKEKHARQQRADGVDRLESDLKIKTGRKVKVNALLEAWGAWVLLADQPGKYGTAKAPGPAYHLTWTHWRDCWAKCVTRIEKDTCKEEWVLLPGFEQDCHDAFDKATGEGLSVELSQALVDEIVADHAEAQRKAAEARKRELAEHAEAAQRAADTALATVEAAQEKVAELVQGAAKDETKEQKEARSVAVADAKAEQYNAQVAAQEAERKKQQLEKDRQKAEKDAKERAEHAAKAKAKAAGEEAPKKQRPEACRAEPLMGGAGGACGTVKDTAALIQTWVAKHDTPDDVLELALLLLSKDVRMSKRAQRACQNAVMILRRAEKDVSLKTP